jgi:hypothetical protein
MKLRAPRALRHVLTAGAVVALTLPGRGAAAQTTTLAFAPSYPTRSNVQKSITPYTPGSGLTTAGINRADCDSSETWNFKLTAFTPPSGAQTLTWYASTADSADCTVTANRYGGTNPICFPVAQAQVTAIQSGQDFLIKDTDIIGAIEGNDILNGSAVASSVCYPSASQTPNKFTLYGILEDNVGNTITGYGINWSNYYDLAGPDPGTAVTGSAGDGIINVSWTALGSDAGLSDALADAMVDAMVDTTADTSTTTTASATDSGASDGDAAAASDGDAADGATDAASSDSSVDASSDAALAGSQPGSAINTTYCPTNGVPFAGVTFPTPAFDALYKCGFISGFGTSYIVKGLVDGQGYAVAIAGVDQWGNSGLLSSYDCAEPRPITDFFGAYQDAGGLAGGGFCAVSAPGRKPASGDESGVFPLLFGLFGAVGGAAVTRRLVRKGARR